LTLHLLKSIILQNLASNIMTLSDTVNLARRLTSRAENADVQEDYHILSIDDCQAMAIALKGKLNKLPSECSQYVGTAYQKAQAKETIAQAKKTITETSAGDANIAFEGMGAAAASVKAER